MVPLAPGPETGERYGSAFTEKLLPRHEIVGQGLGAELIADEHELTRAELDELAVRSYRLAHAATGAGAFEREIVPIGVNGHTVVSDQGIRPETSLDALAALQPAFRPDGKITAGTSSQISDGAAAVLLCRATRPSRSARARARGSSITRPSVATR